MATYMQTRNQLRGKRMVEALEKRNMEACYVSTKEGPWLRPYAGFQRAAVWGGAALSPLKRLA